MQRDVLKINGVATPVVSDGPPDAREAVVCLHGNPGFSDDWLDLIPRVAPFARIVAPDMPGFGDAAKPETFDYSVPGYTRHLAALLDALKIERAHLVLHDFGVGWGLTWAAENPAKVASLTLINIGVLPGYRWHWAARMWRTPWLGELAMATMTHAAFAASLKLARSRDLPKAFVDGMFAHFDAGSRRAVLRLYRATDALGDVLAGRAETFRSLKGPALVIWGARDPYVSVRYAERQKEFFPAAQVHIFEDSGHWPHQDNAQRFAAVVVPFLQSACAGG